MISKLAVERQFFAEHPGEDFDESWHGIAFRIRYGVESYRSIEPELQALYPEHWREIALDHEAIKLDPDYDRYRQMADANVLMIVTARDGDTLVGYHVSMIYPHLHYRQSLTCFTDIFYLRPAYRVGMVGYKMLKYFREQAKARGVQKIYMGTKIAHDIGPLLKRLGF